MNTFETPLTVFLERMSKIDLMKELEEIDGQLRALEAQRGLIAMAIDWKDAASGQDRTSESRPRPASPKDDRPPLRTAILTIMSERPERTWSKRQIYAELEARGWLPTGQTPSNQLSARLSKLVKDAVISRVGTGNYVLARKGLTG